MKFYFQHLGDGSQAAHFFYFLWREMNIEFLFQRQYQIQVLHGIPVLNRLR